MRKVYVLGSALLAVFAFSAFAASSAFAEELPQWLVNSAVIELCCPVTVDIEGTLLVEDMHLVISGESRPDIDCLIVRGLGLLLSNGQGEVNGGECPEPIDLTNLCEAKSLKVTPLHLPWKTELLEPEANVFENDIVSGTGGNPGWLAVCVDVVTVEDECTTIHGKVLLFNEPDGLVAGEFMENTIAEEQAECSQGGKEGLVVGPLLIHALNEKEELIPLAVSLAPEVP